MHASRFSSKCSHTFLHLFNLSHPGFHDTSQTLLVALATLPQQPLRDKPPDDVKRPDMSVWTLRGRRAAWGPSPTPVDQDPRPPSLLLKDMFLSDSMSCKLLPTEAWATVAQERPDQPGPPGSDLSADLSPLPARRGRSSPTRQNPPHICYRALYACTLPCTEWVSPDRIRTDRRNATDRVSSSKQPGLTAVLGSSFHPDTAGTPE
ncbi:unnamed protein product [Arctogadus glacialis]